MAGHDLMILKELFGPVWSTRHPECKYQTKDNDRNNYKINDIIYFREYDPECKRSNKYTGRKITARVNNVSGNTLQLTIIGLQQIDVCMYVDSETYKKLQEENK